MSLIWSLFGFLGLVSVTFFVTTQKHMAFIGILLSILLSISLQIGITTAPDTVAVVAQTSSGFVSHISEDRKLKHSDCESLSGTVSCAGRKHHIKIDTKNAHTYVDGQEIETDQFFYQGDIKAFFVTLKNNRPRQAGIAALTFCLFVLVFWWTGNLSKSGAIYCITANALSFWKSLGKVEKFLLLFFPLIFCLSVTGVDIRAFRDILLLNGNGFDLYFYQALTRLGHWNAEFAGFPYPVVAASMLTPFVTLFAPILDAVHINSPFVNHHFTSPQLLAINSFVYYIYLSSALIFASNATQLGDSQRKLFYAYFLFPVSFYIFGFYKHMDCVTLLFLSAALVLLLQKSSAATLAILVVALLGTKVQSLVLLPALALPFFFVWSQRLCFSSQVVQNTFRLVMVCIICVYLVLMLPASNPHVSTTLFRFPPVDRIWFTVIGYAPDVYLYLSLLCFLSALVALCFLIERSCSDTDVFRATTLGMSITAGWFFAPQLATHSFLAVMAPAFAIVMASPKIASIRKLCLAALAVGLLANGLFYSNSDISRVFLQAAIFSRDLQDVIFPGKVVPLYVSILHTVAVSSLILIGVVFYTSFDRLKSKP